MDNFGLHDKIEINGREFHVHTGTIVENRRIISEVFEGGMFLISREYSIDLRSEVQKINYEFLNRVTQEFHQDVIEELKALHRIEGKLDRFKHPRSHYYLGFLFLRRNLYKESIRQFQNALRYDDSFLKAYMGLGISYLKAHRYDDAVATFKKALEINTKYPDLLNYFGLSYVYKGDYDRAMTLFKEAIDMNPNYVECQFNLGVALYKSALVGVKFPREVAVPARVSIYLKQIKNLDKYRNERWQRSFDQLLDLLKDNNHEIILPQIEEFQLQLVDLVADKEKIFEFYLRFLFAGKEFDLETIDKYQGCFANQTAKNTNYPDFWNDYGTFNLIKSRAFYLKAIAEFEKALELAPEYGEAQENLNKIKGNEKGFLILLRAILR